MLVLGFWDREKLQHHKKAVWVGPVAMGGGRLRIIELKLVRLCPTKVRMLAVPSVILVDAPDKDNNLASPCFVLFYASYRLVCLSIGLLSRGFCYWDPSPQVFCWIFDAVGHLGCHGNHVWAKVVRNVADTGEKLHSNL